MIYETDFEAAMVILTGLMLLSLFIYVLYKAKKHVPALGVLIVVAPITAILLAGGFYLMLFPSNFLPYKHVFMVYTVLFAVLLVRMIYSIIRNKVNTTTLAIFLVYLVCLAFVTIFMRDAKNGGEIFLDALEPFKIFMQRGDASHMQHFLMNMILFLPFGFLGSMVSKNGRYKVLLVTAAGLLSSVMIESIQLSFRLGQCDMSDILANAFGALTGGIVAIPFRRVWLTLIAGGYDDEEE